MEAVDGGRSEAVNGDPDAEPHVMPGILPRLESTAKATLATKIMGTSHADDPAINGTQKTQEEDMRNGSRLTNGECSHLNGIVANGTSASPNEILGEAPFALGHRAGQLPPEIEHITFGYQPFSILISRLVQETFHSLTDVINDMSRMPLQPGGQDLQLHTSSQPNKGNKNTAEGNVQKKLRMLNFASDRRAQFIKILILLGWTRQAEAVSKAIDLNVWTSNRLKEYNDCISWVGELKRMLLPLSDPNPDIKTALEVLSLSKASWLPDLGYLPFATLSPQTFLSTLRRINTLLSIRLNLHEQIPPYFRQFSIASGRVTFRVPDEFEIDLSIAEEEPSSQLFFIDFRFMFSPAPRHLPAGRLRNEIESKTNGILKYEGLTGLFDFLHNLTLTQKLSVFRSQAYDLARGYWSEQLRIEAVHRSVVVQYWCNRPGGRNWVEIGLKRRRGEAIPLSLRTRDIPYISLRWFRDGKEVPNAQVDIPTNNLSLECILKQVITQHTNYIFEQMAAKLKQSRLYSGQALRLRSIWSSTEPLEVALLVQLSAVKAIKLVQEPVSGRFSMLPASALNGGTERELDRLPSPGMEGASQLATLRSFISHEEVERSACLVGWEPMRFLNPYPEAIDTKFASGIQRLRFFRNRGWNSRWALAFATSLEGDSWWIVELDDNKAAAQSRPPNLVTGSSIRMAYKMLLHTSLIVNASYTTIMNVERIAAGMISHYVDTQALAATKTPHRIRFSNSKSRAHQLGSIVIRFPAKASSGVTRTCKTTSPWLSEIVRLDYRGFDRSRCSAIHSARIHMQRSVGKAQSIIASTKGVAFQAATDEVPESITFQCHSNVGETVLYNLENRLQAISLVLDFASIMISHQLDCRTTSLTKMSFRYTRGAKPLEATVHFPENTSQRISLTGHNPHLRIVDHLTERLRLQGPTPVIGVLRITLNLLRAMSAIESGANTAGVEVLTRSDLWYQVRYSEPFSKSSFDIRLRQRRDDPLWFIPESSIKRVEDGNEALEESLKAVVRGSGEGWWAIKGGMIAHVNGIEQLMAKLDEVFRTNKRTAGESNSRKRKAEEVVEID